MGVALALAAAIVYGSSDFLGGLASRRMPALTVVVWSQILGLVLLAIAVGFMGMHAVASDVGFGALCGIAGAFAIVMLYRGLAIGTMGIVSPISAVLGATIPLIYGVTMRGERPTTLAYAGIAAALAAVILVSAGPQARRTHGLPPGIGEALLAGLGFGAYFIALAQTRADAGMVPLLAARAASVVLLGIGGLVLGGVAGLRVARPAIVPVAFCGLFDVSANVLFVLAAHSGLLALAAVLTSLYPAATVALAAIVVHERLRPVQWAGVALALGGAAAIASGA
jgi:drug/metabolite transporter (DMT)-like permease